MERRQKQNKTIKNQLPKVKMSQMDLMQIKNEIAESCSQYYIENLYTCFAYVLHKEFGFGKKRIEKGIKSVDGIFAKISSGELTMEQIVKTLFEDCNLNLEFDFSDDTEVKESKDE